MFIKRCQITLGALGLPSEEQALAYVARHRKSHQAVVLAAWVTRFERQTLNSAEYSKVFAHSYEQVMQRVMLVIYQGRNLDTGDHRLHDSRNHHRVFFAALSCPQCVAFSTSRVESNASIKDCLGKSPIKPGTQPNSCTVSAHS